MVISLMLCVHISEIHKISICKTAMFTKLLPGNGDNKLKMLRAQFYTKNLKLKAYQGNKYFSF